MNPLGSYLEGFINFYKETAMSNIDMTIFNEVMNECPSEVESSVLEHAIFLINKAYAKAMNKEGYADFESIRNDVLDYCGLWDLFTFKPYKSALGKYYVRKRLKEEKEGYEVGTVYEASADHTLLAASKDVKILFRAMQSTSKLRYADVDTGKERFARQEKGTRVSEEHYLKAKRQALAIMNSRRQ